MSFIGAQLNVRGVVQGVGFRYWTVRNAKGFELSGYCANLPDGSVQIEVEGERGIIEEFIKVVRIGPTYASVSDLRIIWYEQPKGYKGFSIKY